MTHALLSQPLAMEQRPASCRPARALPGSHLPTPPSGAVHAPGRGLHGREERGWGGRPGAAAQFQQPQVGGSGHVLLTSPSCPPRRSPEARMQRAYLRNTLILLAHLRWRLRLCRLQELRTQGEGNVPPGVACSLSGGAGGLHSPPSEPLVVRTSQAVTRGWCLPAGGGTHGAGQATVPDTPDWPQSLFGERATA